MTKPTTKPQYKLPPRRWYNLEQACKRIKQLTGEEIGIDDLFYFWQARQLEMSVHIRKAEHLFISDYEFSKDEFSFFENPIYKNENGIFSMEDRPTDEEIEIDIVFSKFRIEQSPLKPYFAYKGLLSIYSSLNPDSTIERELLKNNGLPINFLHQLATPYSEKYLSRKLFSIQFNNFEKARYTYLKPDELYILNDSLDRFIRGNIDELKHIDDVANHRPTNPTNDEVLRLARINAERYPTASANKLVKAIRAYLINEEGYKDSQINKEDTLLRLLKENGIGADEKTQNKTLIIKPVYTE